MTRTVETAEAAEALRGELREFMKGRQDLQPVDLVQYTTLAECSGRAFLHGSLPGGKQVVSELQNVLQLVKAGDILRPGRGKDSGTSGSGCESTRPVPRRRNIYDTSTVRRIREVINYCVDNAALGICTAPFGSGKTAAAKVWMAERGRESRSLFFEFDDFSSSNRVDFMMQLAEMLGLDGKTGSQQAGRVFRTVCEHLRSDPRPIILDQVEMVRPRILQVVRQLFDRTESGVVILAAPILLARMRAAKMADFGAFQSRVALWAQVGGVTKSEVSAILKREEICDIEEAVFELLFKAVGGSIRRLMQAISLLKAKHAGKRVTERTIVGLAASLWGMNIATSVQMEDAWRESDLWNA